MKRRHWISAAIVLLALVLRLVLLDLKPAHFDEGVNGWFVDQMKTQGYYHYDPTNFHGPLHFYVIYIAQTLFGRHAWALRLPLALVSAGCVAIMLAFRPFFGRRVCETAALCMAVSPGYVFYGRYAIHESWLVLFLLSASWGLLGLWHFGTRRYLWAVGLSFAGMVVTKETYVIHVAAMALGFAALLLLECFSPSRALPVAPQFWTRRDFAKVAAAVLGIVVLFYSGFFMDLPSLTGLVVSMMVWTQTGMKGTTGHEKAPYYWLELMWRYEWPALLGLIGAFAVAWPRTGRALRWLAITAGGTLFAYSIVAYKTPWCLISFAWPFYFVLGAAVVALTRRFDRWVVGGATALLLLFSLAVSLRLNFRNYADESEPYVYVQTTNEVHKLLDPLETLVARDPTNHAMHGYIVVKDSHPLPWVLGDFPATKYYELKDVPKKIDDADFLLATVEYQPEIERVLTGTYFRERMVLRGASGSSQWIYFRAEKFAPLFPGRQPEYQSSAAPEPAETE